MTTAPIAGTLDLPRHLYDEIVEHARSDAPFETCGLLAGADGVVSHHWPIPNAARSMTYYQMEPKAMLAAMREMDEQDLELLGIWHSHTHTEAYPSPTDVELATYPGTAYLICSLQDDEPVIRAFDIVDGTITERVLTVAGEPAPTGPR